MLAFLDDKRAECLEEIELCEKDLAEAKLKLKWLNGLIEELEEDAEEDVIVTDLNTETVASYP